MTSDDKSEESSPAERAFAEAAAQGLPKYISDPVVLDKIAAVFLAAELRPPSARDPHKR